jgi:hypothetical protein
VERVTGIEPALSAWEAEVLPLNYTRVACDPRDYGELAVLGFNVFAKVGCLVVVLAAAIERLQDSSEVGEPRAIFVPPSMSAAGGGNFDDALRVPGVKHVN